MNTDNYESVSLFCLTPGGVALGKTVRRLLPMQCYCAEKYLTAGFEPFIGSFAQSLAAAFHRDSAIIVIGATGIVVRTIAPLLVNKMSDPAVIVLDEKGNNIISLLSGHIGGANELTRYLGNKLGANAVITTATDVNNTCAIDMLAKQMCAAMNDFPQAVKTLNQMLVSGQSIGIYLDPQLREQLNFDLLSFDIRGLEVLQEVSDADASLDAVIDVSMSLERPDWPVPSYQLVPKRLVAGIGCKRNTDSGKLSAMFADNLRKMQVNPLSLLAIGSLDIKRNEPALMALSHEYQVPFKVFSARVIETSAPVYEESEFVKKTVGVGAVSQPVAWLLSNGGKLRETIKQSGVTLTFGVLN